MRSIAVAAAIGLLALAGCRQLGESATPTLPQASASTVDPANCTLGEGALPEVEGTTIRLIEQLRDTGRAPVQRTAAALLAGSLANTAGDWERAYGFCALVPTSATTNQRVEAAVCQNKAAVSMGAERTACADLLARQWIADPARIGVGFMPVDEMPVDEMPESEPVATPE